MCLLGKKATQWIILCVGAGWREEADIAVHVNYFPHQTEIFPQDVVILGYNCVSSSDSVALLCCSTDVEVDGGWWRLNIASDFYCISEQSRIAVSLTE